MRYDVVVVGGGTAGCVLAARLSESPDRRVCLVEAGPDYGPLEEGRWPGDILDAREIATTHSWGTSDDGRSFGGRILGGSSAVNACMVVAGSPADYDEWGAGWTFAELRPFLERARATFGTAPANTQRPSAFQSAFVQAAHACGLPLLEDPDDLATPTGVAPFPANVVEGQRWNAAFAYLDPARRRPNLSIVAETQVDRVVLDGHRATGIATVGGDVVEAAIVVLAAGAYFSPAILLRSGIGPERELRAHGIALVEDLPVGKRLLDHCGTDVAFALSGGADTDPAFAAHAVAKAASSSCDEGSWDLHLLPWRSLGEDRAAVIVFLVKPRSAGNLRLRSTDPTDSPLVERGFLTDPGDLPPLLEGIELARRIGASEPLRGLLGAELQPGATDPEEYLRETVRHYYHPAGTCALGRVVDAHGRVFGTEGLYVADASFMPTIPRANTNLTTAAIAERIAATF